MDERYAEWIKTWLTSNRAYGNCARATEEMVKAFPELRRVPGFVFDGRWGQREHWWCVAPDGTIVDPTASQFPVLFNYREYKEGDEVRVGKCMDCGDDLYGQPGGERYFCDSRCEERYRAYLADGVL
jgi:hypothetical protein